MFTPPRNSVVIWFSWSHRPSGVWAPQRPLCRSEAYTSAQLKGEKERKISASYFCETRSRFLLWHLRPVKPSAVHTVGCSTHLATTTCQVQCRQPRLNHHQMCLHFYLVYFMTRLYGGQQTRHTVGPVTEITQERRGHARHIKTINSPLFLNISVFDLMFDTSGILTLTHNVFILEFRNDLTIRTTAFTMALPSVASGARAGCRK